MQLFMWQRDIVGLAHYIRDFFDVLGAIDDAPDDACSVSTKRWTGRDTDMPKLLHACLSALAAVYT